jgi:hypothetical protein
MNLKQLADTLVDKVKKDYANDVSIIHVHGSYIYGNTHNLSDLDIFFVPRTERGYNLGTTFILDGIGCDFWVLPWERLERIAAHNEKIVSILTEGEILYYYSNEDLQRFNNLGKKSLELYKDKNFSVSHAEELSNNLYKIYYKAQKSNTVTDLRYCIIDFLDWLSFILAELNGILIKKGRKYLKEELLAMPIIPKDLEVMYDTLFCSINVLEIKGCLTTLIDELLIIIIIREQKEIHKKTNSFDKVFGGWYEEMIQYYNKIYHACETNDIYTPLFASVQYVNAMNNELFDETGYKSFLPDIVSYYDPKDLSKINKIAKEHQQQFEKILLKNNIKIKQIKDLKELKEYLDTL